MPIKIKNLTSRPLLISLSSGTTLRLSPGQTSGKLQEADIRNNPKIDKLHEQQMIEVTQTGHSKAEAAPTKGENTETTAEDSARLGLAGESKEKSTQGR